MPPLDTIQVATLLDDVSGALIIGDPDDRHTLQSLLDTIDQLEPMLDVGPGRDAARDARAALVARIASASAPDPFVLVETMVELIRAPGSAARMAVSADGSCVRDAETIELFGDFLQEAELGLDQADDILLAAEQGSADSEKINALFRVVHTIKGVAACLELSEVTTLAHATETVLDQVRQGGAELVGPRLERVFEGTHLLRTLLGSVRKAVDTGRAIPTEPTIGTMVEALKEVLIDVPSEQTSGPSTRATRSSKRRFDSLSPSIARSALNQVWSKRLASVRPSTPPESAMAAPLTKREQASMPAAPARAAPVRGAAMTAEQVLASAGEASDATAARGAEARQAEGPGRLKETVKVDLERVESVVEMIGELIIVESMVVNAPEIAAVSSLKVRNYLNQLTKISRDLQNVAMRMRMVPVRGVFQKMARMVRDLSKKTGKSVVLSQLGESVEMDRSMVERIEDPLVHMIRNAVDHGIEPNVADRIAAGKGSTATVRLSAFHEGGSVVIEIADDGRGLSREAILRKARERGLIESGAELTDSEVWQLIFLPGFSTASEVTEISGRGVGMDVVKRGIEAMRGRIAITSIQGKGTTFRLILPLTLAIIDGMLVACGAERYIIPSLSIIEAIRPTESMLKTLAGSTELLDVRGEIVPLLRIRRLFEVPGEEPPATEAHAVVVESMGRRVGLLVDDVITQQQVVIKPLSAAMGDVDYLSGAAILADGRVGLILNVDKLGQLAPRRPTGNRNAKGEAAA